MFPGTDPHLTPPTPAAQVPGHKGYARHQADRCQIGETTFFVQLTWLLDELTDLKATSGMAENPYYTLKK